MTMPSRQIQRRLGERETPSKYVHSPSPTIYNFRSFALRASIFCAHTIAFTFARLGASYLFHTDRTDISTRSREPSPSDLPKFMVAERQHRQDGFRRP